MRGKRPFPKREEEETEDKEEAKEKQQKEEGDADEEEKEEEMFIHLGTDTPKLQSFFWEENWNEGLVGQRQLALYILLNLLIVPCI